MQKKKKNLTIEVQKTVNYLSQGLKSVFSDSPGIWTHMIGTIHKCAACFSVWMLLEHARSVKPVFLYTNFPANVEIFGASVPPSVIVV